MDYEQLSVSELRDACQARGLGTARSRAELIQRLADNDQQASDPAQTSPEPPGEAVQPGGPTSFTFLHSFPAVPDGPDEETHLACRQATAAAAVAAGLRPRGDARLASTRGGTWVYELFVRQAV